MNKSLVAQLLEAKKKLRLLEVLEQATAPDFAKITNDPLLMAKYVSKECMLENRTTHMKEISKWYLKKEELHAYNYNGEDKDKCALRDDVVFRVEKFFYRLMLHVFANRSDLPCNMPIIEIVEED